MRRTTVTLNVSAKRGVGIGADLYDAPPSKQPLRSLSDLQNETQQTLERSIEAAERRKGEG